ncbi:hypothetical protein COCC4DRAFT_33741, partial [Bipolaris maydis ATCC 48331]
MHVFVVFNHDVSNSLNQIAYLVLCTLDTFVKALLPLLDISNDRADDLVLHSHCN